MFLTSADFDIYPYNIPAKQLQNTSFQDFVDKEEAKILKKILGIELYNLLVEEAELESDYRADWANDLIDGVLYEYLGIQYEWNGLVEMLRPYIYALHLRANWDTHDEAGIVASKGENGEVISPALRIVNAYSEFYELMGNPDNMVNSLYGFLTVNRDLESLDTWVFTDPGRMNRFNL